MSIADELRMAALEFSQDDWDKALLEGWRKDLSVAGCLIRASGLTGTVLTTADWDKLWSQVRGLVPAPAEFSSGKTPARVFIAKHARLANKALWDGDYALALKLFRKGGKDIDGRAKNRRDAKQEMKKDDCRIIVKARELSKTHDWKTCK